jgi:tRNA pseudouridine38-40 synthase
LTIALVIEYDGTDFHGFARQPGQRTIEGTLWEAIARIEGEQLEIFGAGRTDAGVHAIGQTVHFVSKLPIEPKRWVEIVNRALPLDVRVRSSRKEWDGFHARFSADSREYRYTFLNRGTVSVFENRYALHEPHQFDVERMDRAARDFVGEHDFRAFTKELEPEKSSVRTVMEAGVRRVGPQVRFTVVGSGFLRGMVRMMAGTLSEIGLCRREAEDIGKMLADPGYGRRAPMLAARGLCLVKVRYRKDRTIWWSDSAPVDAIEG